MRCLIIPLFLGTALLGETVPPKNYQQQELSPQQKQALVKRMLGDQAKARMMTPGTATPNDHLCAIPLLNALRPDTPIPPIRRVPIPAGQFPIGHVKVPPVCRERK